MRKLLIIATFIVLASNNIFAQFDFREGYIITTSNDTINGWIDYKGNKANAKKCLFKDNLNDSPKSYAPNQLLGYRFRDSKFYVTKTIKTEIGEEPLFLEYVINAIVNIYYYRDNRGEHFFVDQGDGNLLPLKNEEKEVFIDGKKYAGKSQEYRQTLKGVFMKSPTITRRVDDLSLNHKSLIKISQDYHQEVCFDQECIIYEKKDVKVKRQFGILAGINSFSISQRSDNIDNFEYLKNDIFNTTIAPNIGVFFKSNFPKINERINLQYAATISFLTLQGDNSYREPLFNFTETNQIEYKRTQLNNTLLIKYEFPQGKIRPTLQVGGFLNYAVSSNYERDFSVIGSNNVIIQSGSSTESPFINLNGGIIFGFGFNFTILKNRELFVDFNYRRAKLVKDYDGLQSSVFAINLGIPLSKKE